MMYYDIIITPPFDTTCFRLGVGGIGVFEKWGRWGEEKRKKEKEIISDPPGHDHKISDPPKMAISFQILPKVWLYVFLIMDGKNFRSSRS